MRIELKDIKRQNKTNLTQNTADTDNNILALATFCMLLID